MKTLSTIILICISVNVFAQRNLFIGFEPSVTVEKYYDKNEFDVNIFPAIFRIPVSKKLDFRISTISNYHFSKTDNGLSNLGISFGLPFYFSKKTSLMDKSKGFYLSANYGNTRNLFHKHYALTFALEPGYSFAWESKFAFHIGLQYGRTLFINDFSQNEWGPHFGLNFHLGWWIFNQE
ncbi:MAG: hypothetical protein JXR68_03830 [Bacteroidales bacterium]|nr:hypothetical protein [Bacteroidales bacterium]